MTIEKKKLYSYTEVTTSELADKVPTLQGGVNKVTTLQKIYNIFKNSFDSVYTTESFATNAAAAAAANRIQAQGMGSIDVYADVVSQLTSSNCILLIRDFPGTGNKRVRMKIEDEVLNLGDVIMTSLSHNDFDVNLMAWNITEDLGIMYLELYFNVILVPSQPILLYINKIN